MTDLPNKDGLEHLVMLTNSLVWTDKITRPDLKAWLDNFTGEIHDVEYERHLALWLLSNFVYYNQSEVQYLCRLLYRDYLHCRLLERPAGALSIEQHLQLARSDTQFHFLGRPGESGGYILYYFRKENSLSKYDFVSAGFEVGPTVENIVLVDDVTLSGEKGQAKSYVHDVKKHFPDKKIYVLTLIASAEAIEFLADRGIKSIAAVVLDEQHKSLDPESSVFFEYPDHRENCRTMVRHYGEKIEPGMPLGYNECQYLFGFFYNTPDNALPIFWSERENWRPIVKRYPKNYKMTRFEDIGTFV